MYLHLRRFAQLPLLAFALSALAACDDADTDRRRADAAADAIDWPAPREDAGILDAAPSDAAIDGTDADNAEAGAWGADTGGKEVSSDEYWTLAVIPDTQASYYFSPSFFEAQTRWIAANVQQEKIAFVLHEGDIVDTNGNTQQWAAARAYMGLLDGKVPYVLSIGNHDVELYTTPIRATNLNTYFPFTVHANRPGFGGAFEPGHLENAYYLLRGGDREWLVLSLEFSPRQAVLEWADGVLAAHPTTPAILLTHAYLYSDGQRYSHATRACQFYDYDRSSLRCTEAPSTTNPQCWDPTCYLPDGADGEMIWQAIGEKHSNLLFVFSGHVANVAPNDAARLTSKRADGTECHQMMANYQSDFSTGGDGYLRLLRFYADGRVSVRTFSPYVESSRAFLSEDRNQFELRVRLP